MKHLKILALAAMACAVLAAFASAASATTLTTTAGVLKAGTALDASLISKTSGPFEDTFGIIQDTYTTSTLKWTISTETGETVSGGASWTFQNYTRPISILAPGSLSVAWTSGLNGAISGSGSEWEMVTPTGTCVYGTATGTKLGTLDGVTSGNAKMTINAVLPLIETVSGSCVSDARWTAEYTVTSPTGLTVQN